MMSSFFRSAFFVAGLAYTTSAFTIGDIGESHCPAGWSANTISNDDTFYCCYGSGVIINDGGYCCLNANNDVTNNISTDIVDDVTSDGNFVFTDFKRADIPEPSCAATVDFKDKDYSSKVSSLSSSLDVTTTIGNSPATNTAVSTTDSGSGSPTAAGASSSTSDAAGAVATANIIGGVLMAGAALVF